MKLTRLGDINYSHLKVDADIKNDKVNDALLQDLQAAGLSADVILRITTAKSDHDEDTVDGRTSRHSLQTAVDIANLDGINSWNEKGTATSENPGNPAFREKGNKVKDALVSMGYLWNKEYGNPKSVLWLTNTGGNHYNHLHVSNRSDDVSGPPSKFIGPKEEDNNDYASSEIQKVKDVASQLGKKLEIGVDGIITPEDIKKMFPKDSLKNLISKGIFGMFSEEVNRIKKLMK